MHQLPNSILLVVAACGGAFASLVVVRRYLPDIPILRQLLLPPPEEEELEELDRRESLADFDHLQGKRGRTVTPLTPSGKARFGDEVVNVISEGELVPTGVDVCVAEVRGTHVLVRVIGE